MVSVVHLLVGATGLWVGDVVQVSLEFACKILTLGVDGFLGDVHEGGTQVRSGRLPNTGGDELLGCSRQLETPDGSIPDLTITLRVIFHRHFGVVQVLVDVEGQELVGVALEFLGGGRLRVLNSMIRLVHLMQTLVLILVLLLLLFLIPLHWREMELTAQLCGESILATRFFIFVLDLFVRILFI